MRLQSQRPKVTRGANLQETSKIPRSDPSFLTRFTIFFGTILLVVLPVGWAYFTQHALPRWYLAYAANELEDGKRDSAVAALDKAYAQDASIVQDAHYWQTRLSTLSGEGGPSRDEVANLVSHMVETLKASPESEHRILMADRIANRLLSIGFAKESVEVMQALFPPINKRSSVRNNQIAYAKSVAKIDLDTALREIDRALQQTKGREPAFLDTKAWVLHQRGENELALEFANSAIDRLYQELFQVSNQLYDAFTPDSELKKYGESSDPEEADAFRSVLQMRIERELESLWGFSRQGIDHQLQTIAVLRHHRASILEALGRMEEAELDRLWLELYDFRDTSQLI